MKRTFFFEIIRLKICIIICILALNDTQAFSLTSTLQQPNTLTSSRQPPKTSNLLYYMYNDNRKLSPTSNENQEQAAAGSSNPKDHQSIGPSKDELDITSILNDEVKDLATSENKLSSDKRLFVIELLKMLHEQYGNAANKKSTTTDSNNNKKEDRISIGGGGVSTGATGAPSNRGSMMNQLVNALNADGDISRLIDWVQNSFTLASVGELTTQFVVGKLASVNCAALFNPDKEETLMPRFLLFNEHFVDVPYEIPLKPTTNECFSNSKFDPMRKTVLLIHGYLGGYTIVDGLTNIKNRILDLNKIVNERFSSIDVTNSFYTNNSFDKLTQDHLNLGDLKTRINKYNVIIVDWFNGANPIIRSRYIRSAVNAQVVGDLIARFIANLIVQCKTSASNVQIIAHSLGCHVAGFTGKSLLANGGHRLGKITHLDPIGLCFGRLFSEPKYRLSPSDARETHAIHVSLNLFDNPLDGAHANFLVNGGRDQIGCGGQSELKNSTSSSIALLFDNESKFNPCSHMRALALFEDDLSSKEQECQIVGYKCTTYDMFLSGKCGKCDEHNNQCRLMSFPSISSVSSQSVQFAMSQKPFNYSSPQLPAENLNYALAAEYPSLSSSPQYLENVSIYKQLSAFSQADTTNTFPRNNLTSTTNYYSSYPVDEKKNTKEEASSLMQPETTELPFINLMKNISEGSIAWIIDDKELNSKISSTIASLRPELIVGHQNHQHEGGGIKASIMENKDKSSLEELLNNYNNNNNNNEIKRSDRRLSLEGQRVRITQTLDKFKTEAKNALSGGNRFLGASSTFSVSSVLNGKNQLKNAEKLGMAIANGYMSVPQLVGKQLSSKLNAALDAAQLTPSVNNNNEPDAPADETKQNLSSGNSKHHHQNNNIKEQQQAQVKQQQPVVSAPVPVPLGGQALPPGSVNGPLYFVGTSSMSPYCVNYYQFRVLIAESRINRLLNMNALAPNRLAPGQHHSSAWSKHFYNKQQNYANFASESIKDLTSNGGAASGSNRQASSNNRETLHLTVKLSDSNGRFFKGFTILEEARHLTKIPLDAQSKRLLGGSENNMVELTMLLNTTRLEPVRISETIISYYFHGIVLADSVQVNYMSNISPEIRSKYSSTLCPVAINDKHQLVRYVECDKTLASGAK